MQSGSSLLCRLQSLFLSQAGGRWAEAAPHGQGSAPGSFPLSPSGSRSPTITLSLSRDAPLWSLSGKSPAHSGGTHTEAPSPLHPRHLPFGWDVRPPVDLLQPTGQGPPPTQAHVAHLGSQPGAPHGNQGSLELQPPTRGKRTSPEVRPPTGGLWTLGSRELPPRALSVTGRTPSPSVSTGVGGRLADAPHASPP